MIPIKQEVQNVLGNVFDKRATPYKNLSYLIETESTNTPAGNENLVWLRRWKNILGYLNGHGASKLKEFPRLVKRGRIDTEKRGDAGHSTTTAGQLRWANKVDFDQYEGRGRVNPEEDFLRISNADYAELIPTWDLVGLPQKEFKERMNPHEAQERKEREEMSLDQLVEAFNQLPKKIIDTFGTAVTSNPESLKDLLRFAEELRKGDSGGVTAKADGGDIYHTLDKQLKSGKIHAAEGRVAVSRIINPRYTATAKDWGTALALAGQVLPVNKVVYQRLIDDIKYASKSGNELGVQIDLDTSFEEAKIYKEDAFDYKTLTLKQALRKKRPTAAIMSGARKATAGVWQARRSFLEKYITEHIGKEQELEELTVGLGKVFEADCKEKHDGHKYERIANPRTTESDFSNIASFLTTVDYKHFEGVERDRPTYLRNAVIDNLSIEEVKSIIPEVKRLWNRYKPKPVEPTPTQVAPTTLSYKELEAQDPQIREKARYVRKWQAHLPQETLDTVDINKMGSMGTRKPWFSRDRLGRDRGVTYFEDENRYEPDTASLVDDLYNALEGAESKPWGLEESRKERQAKWKSNGKKDRIYAFTKEFFPQMEQEEWYDDFTRVIQAATGRKAFNPSRKANANNVFKKTCTYLTLDQEKPEWGYWGFNKVVSGEDSQFTTPVVIQTLVNGTEQTARYQRAINGFETFINQKLVDFYKPS